MPTCLQITGRVYRSLILLPALLLLLAFPEPVALPLWEAVPFTGRRVVYAAEVQTLHSLDEVENLLAKSLYSKEKGLNIRYIGDTARLEAELPVIMESILQKDDYLHYSLRSWRWRWFGAPGDIRLNFLFDHLTTREEGAYVEQEVARILQRIIAPAMDDHQKVKAIHDYVVASVAYDTTLREYSAYAALSKGKAVCQGYALLTYKMLHSAGVEARIISGSARGEKHAWNLVRLDGNWYHLDATWNSPVPDVPGRVIYAYYNRSDEAMRATHTWDQDQYPAAAMPYRTPPGLQLNNAIMTAYVGEKWPARVNQPADKMWVIRFNQRINPNSANNRNIFVADREANLYPVRVHAGDDGRSAYVVPERNYPVGETLYLLIGREVISRAGDKMEMPAWMEFSVQ